MTYYSCTDNEILTWEDHDDAIEEYLDGVDELPEEVTAKAYVPLTIDERDRVALAMSVLEHVLESLDDEYRHPGVELDPIEDHKSLLTEARRFIDVVVSCYQVTNLERDPSQDVTVDVEEWNRKRHTMSSASIADVLKER